MTCSSKSNAGRTETLSAVHRTEHPILGELWIPRKAGRAASVSLVRMFFSLVLPFFVAIASIPPPNHVAADLLKGAHYAIEFDDQDRESAELIATFIDESWDDVSRAVGAAPRSPPVRVIIPASPEEFRRLAGVYDKRWVVAVAIHPGSLMVVKPPRLLTPSLNSLRQTVRHELVHIMVSRVSNMDNMPRWLNEGLAMRVSGEMGKRAEWIIAGAVLRGALIPLDELDENFPVSRERASVAYAESLSVVNYIAEAWGEEALLDLIGSLQNQNFHGALDSSLGLDLHTLGERWIRSVRISPYVVTLVSSTFALWLMTVLAILAFLHKRRLAHRRKWEWEMEEAMGNDL